MLLYAGHSDNVPGIRAGFSRHREEGARRKRREEE